MHGVPRVCVYTCSLARLSEIHVFMRDFRGELDVIYEEFKDMGHKSREIECKTYHLDDSRDTVR